MNTSMNFLLWVRGPGLNIAVTVFIMGVLIRILEIFILGRAHNYAEARQSELMPGLRTVFSRFIADAGTFQRAPFNIIVGYVWHVGFLLILFLFVPHLEFFGNLVGIVWLGLPNPLIDGITAITLVALIAMLIHRLRHPVLRYISTFEDYLVWTVTFLPLLTGYLAYHRLINPYPLILGLHLLSVEVFLIVFPFTKLIHAKTAILARWYNGATFGRKGVQS